MNSRLPLVIILGATGTGKTKLSLELAQKFGGEVINADSMQVYKGLDIVTAKATKAERSVAPHHLLDIIEPHQSYSVSEFKLAATKIIDDVFKAKRLPIIVGGTNYYIEALLWKILVDDPPHVRKTETGRFDQTLSLELHSKLKELDPDMAKRLHPNNKRKILRSLEIIDQYGRKHSDILKEQQSLPGASSSGGPLRYFNNSVVLWMQCEQSVLDQRLNSRVDKMIEEGLLDELTDFHKRCNQHRIDLNKSADYTKGIFQSIGFKEFHKYLILNVEERKTETGERLFQQGISDMKMVTRRFAKKQITWINNRFLGRSDRQTPPVYALDTTNINLWGKNILQPAIEIIECLRDGTNSTCIHKPLERLKDLNTSANANDDTFYCHNCSRTFIGTHQYGIHLNSNKHRNRIASIKKKQKRMENKEAEVAK